MKGVLLLIIGALFSGIISGQIAIDSTYFNRIIEANSVDFSLDSKVTNTGKSTINVVWKRTVVSKPSPWDNYVCTFEQCYDTTIFGESFELKSNQTAPLFMHFNPYDAPGEAVVRIVLSEEGNPSNSAEVNYKVTAKSTSTNEKENDTTFIIYPNLAFKYFTLNNQLEYEMLVLSNYTGQVIKAYTKSDNYEVHDILPGVYFVHIFSKQRIIKVLKVVIGEH